MIHQIIWNWNGHLLISYLLTSILKEKVHCLEKLFINQYMCSLLTQNSNLGIFLVEFVPYFGL